MNVQPTTVKARIAGLRSDPGSGRLSAVPAVSLNRAANGQRLHGPHTAPLLACPPNLDLVRSIFSDWERAHETGAVASELVAQ